MRSWLRVDETALGDRVRAMLASAEVQMQAQVAAGVPMHDAQQAVTFKFNQECQQLCLKALEERDLALIHYAKKGPAALHVLQRAGALVPPWLLTRPPGRPLQQQLEELADVLDGSREQREYEMRARVVRTATEAKYNQLRPTPESMYDPDISHVIRYGRPQRVFSREVGAWDQHESSCALTPCVFHASSQARGRNTPPRCARSRRSPRTRPRPSITSEYHVV